jgi:hypothetical protein
VDVEDFLPLSDEEGEGRLREETDSRKLGVFAKVGESTTYLSKSAILTDGL